MTDATSLDTDPPGLAASAEEVPSTDATSWLAAIADAEKAFRDYQDRSDNIDKQYANLARLASTTRDREIQLFWANISVMGPSVYSRPPVPVVIPRWKQRDELPRTTSEMLERAVVVTFEQGEGVDYVMRLLRDDLVILARGAPWIRLEGKKVCIEHVDRKDFLHAPARNWSEVDWVTKRSWLDKEAAGKRFQPTSGDAYKSLQYAVRKDAKSDSDDGKSKAGIWELWCKSANKVVWVSEGCDTILDQGPPHLTLEGFFPCPRPAFGTLERRTLRPVPDMVFYKDQIEEINEITARIAALTEAVRVRGFYPAGAGEIGDAIEAAVKSTSNNQVLVPISNWAALGGGNAKDVVLWWPIEVVTAAITGLVELRKQLIEDVYQITGLSDIMRGQSEASETLGAQQLKTNFGQIRIKDKQDELTRVARDITRITGEIIAENFDGDTLMEMTQMRLPSDADIAKEAAPLTKQLQEIGKALPALEAHVKQIAAPLPELQAHLQSVAQELQHAQSDPETAQQLQQLAQSNPDQAKQIVGAVQQQMQEGQQKVQAIQQQVQAGTAKVQQMQQQGQALQGQLKKLADTITIDKVLKLLREQKIRPFILDIETDSTIAPDENASKQRATEFVTAVGGYLKNSIPLLEGMPQAAPMVGETLKFIVDQFRAGRELQGVIDKFADDMEAKAEQPPPPNPEMVKQQAEAAKQQHEQQIEAGKAQSDAQTAAASAAKDQAQAQKDAAEAQAIAAEAQRVALEADTAAKDADLKRKIEAQRELDASDARRQKMADDAAMAELQRVAAKEKHAQDMDKGRLEIVKGGLAVEQNQQTLTAARETTAKETNVKEAHDVKPHLERLMSSTADIHERLQALTKANEDPIEILYGPDGKVSGRKIGDRVQMIQRKKEPAL